MGRRVLECNIMAEKIPRFKYKFPNDDGKRQRAWVTDCDERGRSACERVMKILGNRPWIEETVETEWCGEDDANGVDIFMRVDERLARAIGVWSDGQPIPVQVKSSEHEQRKFEAKHRKKMFNLERGEHLFVLDGQDALDVIAADLVGQMTVLVCLLGAGKEQGFLDFLETVMGDAELVKRYRENRELITQTKWYGQLILGAAET